MITGRKAEKMYLDWFNNYLSIEWFAFNHNISIKEAEQVINTGRMINHLRG